MTMKRIFYGENEYQFGDLRLPDGPGPYPVAIVLHGGFWRARYGLDLMDDFAQDLTSRGLATWNIEYRRVGHEGGAWPGTLTDVANAIDHVKILAETFLLDLDRVMTIGHSAGGHLALWAGARHKLPSDSVLSTTIKPLPLKGVISLAGVADLALMQEVHAYNGDDNPTRNLIGGTPEELPERYKEASPIEQLPLGIQQVLIHGSLDINVPIGISQHYVQAALEKGDPVKLVEIPTAEHFKIINPMSDEWSIIADEALNMVK